MELNAVLLKACAPNPRDRYQSAEEMNADLALLHSGESVQHRHVLQRRVKVLTRVGVALAVAVLLGEPLQGLLEEGAARVDEHRQPVEPGELLPDTRRSDHTPFWEQGIPAVMRDTPFPAERWRVVEVGDLPGYAASVAAEATGWHLVRRNVTGSMKTACDGWIKIRCASSTARTRRWRT